MGNRLGFALLLIASTLLCSGCVTKPKGIIMDFPDYFDLPAGSELTTVRDYGNGPQPVQIKTMVDMGCYSGSAQTDVLSVKKGVK